MQGDGELTGPEVGAEVPADLAHRVDDVLTDLLGERCEIVLTEGVEILRAVDAVEDAGHLV
jgi:hypothetical protein